MDDIKKDTEKPVVSYKNVVSGFLNLPVCISYTKEYISYKAIYFLFVDSIIMNNFAA